MTQDDYNNKFEVDKHNSELLKAAFTQVSDIRKFEIELYWKRANYFWALIAVAFAGYFAALSSDNIENKYFISIIIANIGFVLPLRGFYLVEEVSIGRKIGKIISICLRIK